MFSSEVVVFLRIFFLLLTCQFEISIIQMNKITSNIQVGTVVIHYHNFIGFYKIISYLICILNFDDYFVWTLGKYFLLCCLCDYRNIVKGIFNHN